MIVTATRDPGWLCWGPGADSRQTIASRGGRTIGIADDVTKGRNPMAQYNIKCLPWFTVIAPLSKITSGSIHRNHDSETKRKQYTAGVPEMEASLTARHSRPTFVPG